MTGEKYGEDEVLLEASRNGDGGMDDDRDHVAMSKSLFFRGGGRTMDSDRSMARERRNSSAPNTCSTRSISSSSGGDSTDTPGVSGTELVKAGDSEGSGVSFPSTASELFTTSGGGLCRLDEALVVNGMRSRDAPFRSFSLVTIFWSTDLLPRFPGSKSKSLLRISMTSRYGARSAELRTTHSPGGIRTIRWCGDGTPFGG